ncbi:MAG: hypothetical protein Q9169_006628 [Polycauliona sp. 2 TL-2023]
MATTTNSRIWESPGGDGRNGHHASQAAMLPSITALTNDLPAKINGPASSSPTYPPNNRDSDQWPSQPQSTRLPTINQHHEYRGSHEYPQQGSRRSSIGSEVNGFRNLQINNASSPYATANQSTTSIQANLQRERGIAQGQNGVRNSRASGNGSMHHQPMSPLGNGLPEKKPGESQHAYNIRTAPKISANPMREVYNADKPTAGQPYAFPDPGITPSTNGSNENLRQGQTPGLSRRNSDHTSINSSLYTTDSRLPGNHQNPDGDIVPGTHHHSLQQHKQVSNLVEDDIEDEVDATSPYSRTPALRASHKMAERKRRTEMKSLFDSLRNQIPPSHGSKSSKWEILSKASEYIKRLEHDVAINASARGELAHTRAEADTLRRENESLRAENHRLFQEIGVYQNMPRGPTQHQHYGGPPAVVPADSSRSLPPLMNGAHASSMQGVQYTDGVR